MDRALTPNPIKDWVSLRMSFPHGTQNVEVTYQVKDKRYKRGLKPPVTIVVPIDDIHQFIKGAKFERAALIPMTHQSAADRPCTDSTSN